MIKIHEWHIVRLEQSLNMDREGIRESIKIDRSLPKPAPATLIKLLSKKIPDGGHRIQRPVIDKFVRQINLIGKNRGLNISTNWFTTVIDPNYVPMTEASIVNAERRGAHNSQSVNSYDQKELSTELAGAYLLYRKHSETHELLQELLVISKADGMNVDCFFINRAGSIYQGPIYKNLRIIYSNVFRYHERYGYAARNILIHGPESGGARFMSGIICRITRRIGAPMASDFFLKRIENDKVPSDLVETIRNVLNKNDQLSAELNSFLSKYFPEDISPKRMKALGLSAVFEKLSESIHAPDCSELEKNSPHDDNGI